jgi:LPS-assembly protein
MTREGRGKVRTFLSLLIALFIFYPSVTLASPSSKANPPPMSLYADQIEHQGKNNTVIAQGFVDIRYKDMQIQADYVKINTVTGNGFASGNVDIKDKDSQIFCEKAHFNIFKKQGTIYNGNGFVNTLYYVTARQLEWLGENKYKVKEGTISSCQGESPPWSFHMDEADITLDKHALLKNPSFHIKNIPFFYTPRFYVPMSQTKRNSGFLTPQIGFGNEDGFTLGNSFFWAIGGNSDATFGFESLGKRGVRPRLEYRYVWDKNTSGTFNGSFLRDQKTDENFYKIDFEHEQKFKNDVKARLKLDMLSENNGDKEFEKDIKTRTRRYSDSFLDMTKSWENSTLQFYSEYLEELTEDNDSDNNTSQEVFAKLPEIIYTFHNQQIKDTPFYFQLQSSAADFYREENYQKEQQVRFDVFPKVSMPYTKFSWFSITPSLGLRQTYYNPLQGGSGDNLFRQMLFFDLDFNGPKSYRIYKVNWDKMSAIKHSIEPRITYSYSPEWVKEKDREGIIKFDSIDDLEPKNHVQFSLINRILAKEKGSTREIVRFEVGQGYDIREYDLGNQAPFSELSYDLETHILPFLEVNLDGAYDIYENSFTQSGQEIKLRYKKWGFVELGRRYARPSVSNDLGETEEFYNIGFGIDFIKNFAFQYSTRYDATTGLFLEKNYSFGYQGSCFNISFNFIDRTTENDHFHQKSEYEFGFLISLYGLGSFGKDIGGNPIFSLYNR